MTTKVIPMKPKKPASPKVKPPDTWAVHSPVGVLKNIKGDGLERLEAIHAFLMEQDRLLTSEDAAVRVFGPFIADANSALGMKHGAAKLRPFLHIVDPSKRAVSIGDFAGQTHLANLAELVPYVHHTHFERGTPEALLYALGVMAGEVWSPHGSDVDLNDRWGDECPDGIFPSAEECKEIVAPLAVPFALAHSLWGWGTLHVAASVDSGQVAEPATASATPANGTRVQPVPLHAAPPLEADTAPVEAALIDWDNPKTQAALVAALKNAVGKSVRAKAAYLANTEKWCGYGAETLRKKAALFQKAGVGKTKSNETTLSSAWSNTQSKSKKTG